MLYELSLYEVMTLRDACTVAQHQAVKCAEFFERGANDQCFPEPQRASAARVATWHQERAATFYAVRKALNDGRKITTLAQAKEALER